ncbi:MAG: DNA recombination protein RmuC [Candidatus Colwellbacteria bacterium]|jgi:DNA recombination protein RmuC|nr:DNA recombination protein RmuC [Candidatus Colwellbacteria bacterium]MDD3752746.1 DNA recombination protein RmuC [Candidatus Colwellbacteria bacterium]MDD4818937.1 DNA recombination protein RmuC [Candidatus Colwellbacteria bacterium]
METAIAITAGMLVGAVIFFIAWRLLGSKREIPKNDSLMLLQNQMSELSRTLDTKLGEVPKMMQVQFSESAKIIKEITQELTRVSEGQKQVVGLADQLKGLEDILKNPKQRGVLGEYFLEETLKNVLPPNSYEMQYKFSDGEIVDAVVFVKEKIIPIDSKFSLENYERILNEKDQNVRNDLEKQFKADLKKRIDETSKYVRPEENTTDFAFMFIPSEAIYYDLLVNKVGAVKVATRDLIEYAFKDKKVIIVSPTSFLAYLQTVLQGLRALQIEESAKEIRKRVEDLGRHLSSYEDFMKKLGTHLGTSVGMYNRAYKELGKIDKDVLRIAGDSAGMEPISLDKPDIEE